MFSAKDTLSKVDPELWGAIEEENQRQEDHIELIASENYVSHAVMAAQGSQLTNKYAEAKIDDSKGLKRYCFNFEGNGLRYLLQELLIMISDERTECTRLFNEESETLADILEIINQRG